MEAPADSSGGGGVGDSAAATTAKGVARAGSAEGPAALTAAVTEIRCPGPRPLRLLEWKVAAGTAVQIGTVLAVCLPIVPPAGGEAGALPPCNARRRAGEGEGEGGGGGEGSPHLCGNQRGEPSPCPEAGACGRTQRLAERRVKSERAGVVLELCVQRGQVVPPGGVLVRLEGCSHPVVMKGLCAECGQDLTQLQSKNGKQQVPLSTATVSMVHSVPELMVSSEQAEQLGREDQQRLHRNRKLVLMVDLDQTLIHTTEQHCQQMSNKGIFHFQLGRGEPMLHTRLRPHCKEFLEKIAKLYELHVFTFGSRLYAHTIAGFLDPEKKLFSHRILSRDECIDPFSKTGNLRNLFPCGDSMVCIIDDREDVWKFAPNLITVKKYVYFQGIGDINAPPGSRETQMKKKGTEKVRQAQECKHLHVVNPDWLWSCLERWDKVEEQLFPLKEDYIKTQRENSPATFPDIQSAFPTALFHPTPIHPKCQPGPEVRIYDSNTGKLIRKGTQNTGQSLYIQSPASPVTLPVHGEHSSFRVVQPHQQQMFGEELPTSQDEDEQPGPSRRKRQPSMSETMPLYTLCKEDLESMDKEVDDILGEGSDDSDTEKKKLEEEGEQPQKSETENLGTKIEQRSGSSSSSSERSLTGSIPRGHKRKLNEDDAASESSKESSNEDEEGSSSEADEMAAALEAELNDFM
ncbi:RNA polymerase II subunit A C-terminal domain phosphatase isoform X5 [Sarcophilus harrisii]|uniref:RNA polymerase II subunit A C-terminal domain phosphatase isoform X5 n=1 Tax=Sarcophilus harrisii TaxID=9305 RepID=UPI001301AF63|nr:RNA polymerase II subunit A C-terminal domain phosphatase isoform X5 [Sarcophilus harrisii]